jgi:hypothetical protein
MEKIKIFYDSVLNVEDQSNTWLNSNNIIIKNIKTEIIGQYLILIILYKDKHIHKLPNISINDLKTDQHTYESDNMTAMNCKVCGKPKCNHNNYQIG